MACHAGLFDIQQKRIIVAVAVNRNDFLESTLEKMKAVLLHADKKKAVTEEIKKQTKPSIVEALRRGMDEQRKKDSEKQAQEKQKKQNMEL